VDLSKVMMSTLKVAIPKLEVDALGTAMGL
jgi:hypothetical protein